MRRVSVRRLSTVAAPTPAIGPAVTVTAGPSTAARTARVRVGLTVYRLVVPIGDAALAVPPGFLSLADHIVQRATVAARPASVVLLDADPIFTPPARGWTVDAAHVVAALAQSIRNHRVVDVPLTPVAAPGPGASTESVIVVHAGENKLYLYEHHVLSRTFDVATGSPDFPTPKGRFSIRLMRNLPTWINPHPTTGWGLTLPAKILPGPSNPLGLRAMNLTAPNIRIHGTPQNRSIGYSVSHGCIRMHNSDVVQLFALVGTGTTVFVVQTAPPRLPPPGSGIPTAIDPAQGG